MNAVCGVRSDPVRTPSGMVRMEVSCTPVPPLPLAPSSDALAPGLWASAGLIASYFVLQLVAGMLFVLVFSVTVAVGDAGQGGTEAAIAAIMQQPATLALLAMFSLGVAAPLTLWLAHRKWRSLWSLARPPGLGFAAPRRPLFFALAVLVGLSAPLLGGLLTQWLAHGHTVTQDIRQLGGATPMGLRIPLVLVVVGVGPLVEELLFRGVLLSALLRRWPVGWAVAASSLLFALIHLPGLHYQWYALPGLVLLALALAGLRLYSASIWPSVLAHASNNLLAVAVWFVAVHPPG
jgi:membrane protease YdiL (CAAX protease family)